MDLLFYSSWNCAVFFFHLFLATNDLTQFDFKTIGFITPIGGVLLILGWIVAGVTF